LQIEKNYSKEFEYIQKAYDKAGGDVSGLLTKDIVSIIVSGHKILGRNTVEGVHIEADCDENHVKLYFKVDDGVVVKKPVHLCVGYLKDFGEQNLDYEFDIGNNVIINFISHCSFPAAKDILHKMKSKMIIGNNSKVTYEDVHFHNEEGLVNLDTDYETIVGNNSKYDNRFTLTKTRVGNMKIKMDVDLKDDAKAYIETKVREKKDDYVEINEILRLNGKNSSGIAKTFVIATDESKAKVITEAYGNGDYSKGHIECDEIVDGPKVDLSTIPLLRVKNELAELTHEASVGRINSDQLETLMSKGLTEEEASEMIIKSILK
jgi:hypothetical protein